MRSKRLLTGVVIVLLALLMAPVHAQMDLSQVSGQPRPDPQVPVGTMTVRVVKGSITNNIVNQKVEITIDGTAKTLTTDAGGRVEVTGLKPGAHAKAVVVVDGERVESQDITVPSSSGLRLMLVAGLPGAANAAGAPAAPSAAAVPGSVSFGPESLIVAEFDQDRLSVYYLLDIVNPTTTPIDAGGPLILDLPREARGATALQDSTKQATVNGPRITVVGPFAPGAPQVRVGFELPSSGGTARVSS